MLTRMTALGTIGEGATNAAPSDGEPHPPITLDFSDARRMVAALTVFAMLAAADKNFLTLMVADIKADLGVSDVQVGLLIGLAFAVSNVAVSVPAGWLADRGNRRLIVAGGVTIWSAMAAACGFAASFGQLFLARVGVGLGEGISPPASYSLIRDGVPPERRGLAYSVYSIGGAVGSGIAFLVGGLLIRLIQSLDLSRVPLLSGLHAWQIALIVIGVAGLPLALLAFSFSEPGRHTDPSRERVGIKVAGQMACLRWRVLLPLLVFSVAQAMLTFGLTAWVPALLQRTFGQPPSSFGPMLGLVLIVGAPIGLVGAGLLIDRLNRRGPAIVAVVASAAVMLAGAIGPHVPSIGYYWIFQAIIIMASTVYLPVTSTVVAREMPANAIGITMATFLFVQGIIGAGLGPVVIAALTQHVFAGSAHALNAAITTASLVLGATTLAAAAVLLFASGRDEGRP